MLAYNDDLYEALMYYLILLGINAIFFAYLIYYIAKNKMKKIKEIFEKIKQIIAKLRKSNDDEEEDS